MLRDDALLARTVRIIDALGPSTIQLRAQIWQVLTTMHEDAALRERLALGMVERFVPVGLPPMTTSA